MEGEREVTINKSNHVVRIKDVWNWQERAVDWQAEWHLLKITEYKMEIDDKNKLFVNFRIRALYLKFKNMLIFYHANLLLIL
jgi:hypothetical protein